LRMWCWPGAAFAEKDGTFSNTERRVQLIRKAVEPPGDAKPDWRIICELAKRLTGDKASWEYASPAAVMAEAVKITPQYAWYQSRQAGKGRHPMALPVNDHPGTKILHVGRFSHGLGKFSAVESIRPLKPSDIDYPLTLTTGRRLQHYHSGSMTHRVAGLNTLLSEERMEIHPLTPSSLGLKEGDMATVTSRRGQVKCGCN